MRFTKMHGAGNDFIIFDDRSGLVHEAELGALAKRLCTPHLSIGADGLMAVGTAKKGGDFSMLFYNADGSPGEMCGNGARCIARYGYEHGLAGEEQLIETGAGPVTVMRISETLYRVRLNDPSFIDLHCSAEALGRSFDTAYMELGDPGIPHSVLLMPELESADRDALRALGRELRYSPAYPRGANVNFVLQTDENSIRVLTYERGVEDFTLACGTGSGSSVAALTLLGLVSGKNVSVTTAGGELFITLDVHGERVDNICLTGPAEIVFEGEIAI